jgi:DNA-binding NarL/FixJ family response regulator
MKYINYINALSENIRHKSLSTIERDIVSLLCDGKTYIEIAEKLSYDDGYVGSVSRELYGLTKTQG